MLHPDGDSGAGNQIMSGMFVTVKAETSEEVSSNSENSGHDICDATYNSQPSPMSHPVCNTTLPDDCESDRSSGLDLESDRSILSAVSSTECSKPNAAKFLVSKQEELHSIIAPEALEEKIEPLAASAYQLWSINSGTEGSAMFAIEHDIDNGESSQKVLCIS